MTNEKSEAVTFHSIGVIHSPFKEQEGMPIQPKGAKNVEGYILLNEAYKEGLKDIDGFSHLIIIYHFHKSSGFSLTVTPFLDTQKRGLFATRAPKRPNPLGISIVRLTGVSANRLELLDVDVLDGTPLLDIKPYVPGFDAFPHAVSGWLTEKSDDAGEMRSDDRFK